jgi:hypothetical protein
VLNLVSNYRFGGISSLVHEIGGESVRRQCDAGLGTNHMQRAAKEAIWQCNYHPNYYKVDSTINGGYRKIRLRLSGLVLCAGSASVRTEIHAQAFHKTRVD